MSLRSARALWGRGVVRRALADAGADAPTVELCDSIQAHVDPPGVLRSWALAQPWPRFCAIVRVVSGQTRRETAHEGSDQEMSPRRAVAEDMTIHVRVTGPELAILDAEVERQKTLAPGATVTRTSVIRGLIRALEGAQKGGKPARKPKS